MKIITKYNLTEKFRVLRDFGKEQSSFNVKTSKTGLLYGFKNAAYDILTGKLKYTAKELEALRA